MKVNIFNKQQNISFESKIHSTSVLGFGVNRAIEMGDKGFFNALKHLSNDGLKREILVGGSNSTNKDFINATATLRADKHEYLLKSSQNRKSGLDAFQLMGENVIKLIKKLAGETGNISQEVLGEKSTKKALIKEGNEAYRTIFS